MMIQVTKETPYFQKGKSPELTVDLAISVTVSPENRRELLVRITETLENISL